MKVRVLLNIGRASGLPALKQGVHDVDPKVGVKLIERGWAVALEKPAKEVKAVPPPSSISGEQKQAAVKAVDDVKTYRAKSSRADESKSPANKEQ